MGLSLENKTINIKGLVTKICGRVGRMGTRSARGWPEQRGRMCTAMYVYGVIVIGPMVFKGAQSAKRVIVLHDLCRYNF